MRDSPPASALVLLLLSAGPLAGRRRHALQTDLRHVP